MILFGYLLKLVNSTKYPFYAVIIWGCVVFGGSYGLDYFFGDNPVEINRTVEEDRRIGEQLLSMREQVEELHIHLASFAHGVMDKAPDIEERRQRLQDTLIVQDAAASTIVGDRDGPATLAATAYRASLRNMKTEVEGVTDFMSLADFWKAASDLLVARNEFLRELSNYRHSADS